MTTLIVKHDREEYRVAINGEVKVDCLDCFDTGVIIHVQHDDIWEGKCQSCWRGESDTDCLDPDYTFDGRPL